MREEHKSTKSAEAYNPLLSPVRSVPDNIEASLVVWTQNLRHHEVVLSEPRLVLLMPSPVPVIAGTVLVSIRWVIQHAQV